MLPIDPPGLSSFHMYDAESFSVISAINDALVHIDEDGEIQPALATRWRRVSPVEVEFDLRENVRFHNGELFDADSVVATFQAHRDPTPSMVGHAVLSIIKQVRKVHSYRVRIETAVPDVMLLRRLFWGQIYPKGVLESAGRDSFAVQPIGTGAYQLQRYDVGREILLKRNRDHWAATATVDEIRLPILRQKEWVDHLASGEVDVVWNLDSHDCIRAQRLPGVQAASRIAAVSQRFLLAHKGPLADVRVRRALNHAINRRMLVELTEHGRGEPQRSMATTGEPGYIELEPYRYSPELARRMLEEAGYGGGFALHGLVSDTSTGVYFTVREFLSRVNVNLEAEILPRPQWFERIQGGKMSGHPYTGDFAVLSVDNPLFHPLYHCFSFLSSHSPCSLIHDSGYDQLFHAALTDLDNPALAYAKLERYTRDEALMLFTVQQQVHAAWREGVHVVLPRSGHFDASAFWKIAVPNAKVVFPTPSPRPSKPPSRDVATLLEGTSHTGTFFLRPGVEFEEPGATRVWRNLVESEQRWRVQNEPMLHQIVGLVEARTNLANVLGSTDRVAIVGYSAEGRRLFANKGYEIMFGADATRTVVDFLGADGPQGWTTIRAAVAATGSWLGPVALSPDGRPPGAPTQFFLTVTPAHDDDSVIGHTFVFTDFSGAEERIRHAAIRTILDNLPYGLFVIDREGRMKAGYSEACRAMFSVANGGVLEGRSLTELLAMNEREAGQFEACYGQVFEDFLPPEVSLGNLRERIGVEERTFSLRGSVIRDAAGGVTGVLFTMIDISNLILAEREAERLRATVLVLQFRDSFERFAREFDARLARFVRDPGALSDQDSVRMALHTAKGVLGQFSLRELAERIHHIEDGKVLDAETLDALRHELRHVLDRHRSVWRIDLDESGQTFEVPEVFLGDLEREVARARDLPELRDLVLGKLSALREKSAAQILGPIADGTTQLAARRDKRVRLEVEGGDVRVPAHCGHALATIVHLVRNAIDHGIEPVEKRGDKPPVASLRVVVTRSSSKLCVEVADDGQGIDAERLVQRAVELGLVDGGATMSESEKLLLVFVPGVSTAETVTDTSGRGVGAGAVWEALAAIGGSAEVRSERGRGTSFILDLPIVDVNASGIRLGCADLLPSKGGLQTRPRFNRH